MRICYVANSASVHTEKWAKYFSDLGHDVHIISHCPNKISGVKVHYINYNLRNFIFMKRKVHNLINIIDPDVVHAHQANTCGFYATTQKKYKVILSAWGSDILVNPNKSVVLKKMVKYIIKNAYFITSDSKFMSSKIIELGGNKDRIYTFPMGLEDSILPYKRKIKHNEYIKIISTRRLESIYNIDVLIKGFYKALMKNSNLQLIIAADGSEFNNLKDMVRSLNIDNNVEFIGRYKGEEVGKLLEKNDIFISIPSSDSTSVSLLEAMYCGLFPIVSDLPANKEWIQNKENGIIIKNINSEEVCNSILWCVNNLEVVNNALFTNRDIIKKHALWKDNSKIVENLYNKIIKLKNKKFVRN
ncbi:hypothetical protein A0J52_09470 [Clostridium sporogenes]|uniref:glycosyltransferase family 4 protein n=1 Tax=Clostridium TaxID=1485 RepID=UPI0007801ABD|nr:MULTISPECIES: glycosyltransferase family 4 protein [Clostridium]KYN77083.1 hypothetical protein A0J52_09470 [Clostridium sporogenes]MBE6056057.1 glycosyltransferase family 4 protein [Clostridium sp.]NFM18830.1 glycosyltransferase family 4 protein [Clostridium sporogenes]